MSLASAIVHPQPGPDLAAIKERQRSVWASGDYSIIGTSLQIVGERLCEAVDLAAGEEVIDVAAGNGNATLAAARRFASVTSTDYVGALLERGKERAIAERLPVTFREADAESLPFAPASFDVALSTFGVMFAPDQAKAASELMRVVRPGGRIGLASWTPDSFIGQLFGVIGRHVPPAPGLAPPSLWGSPDHLAKLFPGQAIRASLQTFTFRYRSAAHWLDIFGRFYGPTHRALASLEPMRREQLEADILALLERSNRAGAGSLVVPSEYLEAIVLRS